MYIAADWDVKPQAKKRLLVLLNPNLSFFENSVDPNQLASDEAI